jgi:hypothetical protein
METGLERELWHKVQAVAASRHGDLLRQLVEVLYLQVEEYDRAPLHPEELAMIQESKEQLRRGGNG